MRYLRRKLLAVLGMICLLARPAGAANLDPAQLVGSWVRTNVADMQGLEFDKNGKVLVYYGGGNDAMTADYSVTDDGRLNLSMGGQATFFLPALSGDQLQLKQPETGNIEQFRRLKPGETIASAIAGQADADKKSVDARNAALPDFLVRKDLVMLISGGGTVVPASSVIELVPTGNGYAGHVCYDSNPPRIETITAQIQGSPENPSAVIAFPQNNNLGQVTFRLTGSGADISLTAQVNFASVFDNAPNHTAVIKPDPNARKQILDRFQAEAARLNALRAPILALLKDYVVLKGTSQSTLPAEHDGFSDQFILAQNAQNGTWAGQGQSVNRATGATEIFPVMAAVGIAGGKPVIQIASQKRIYQFAEIDTAAGKMSGVWQMPQNPNSRTAELTISQSVDAKDRDQLFTGSKKALQELGPSTVFHGLINDQYTNGTQPPNAIAVTLTAGANGTITGTADYPLEGCTMTLTGRQVDTPLGPQLQLHYTAGKANPGAWGDVAAFINLVQHETWLLTPAIDSNNALRLTGYSVTNPTPNAPQTTLQLIPYSDKDKTAITAAFGSGVQFKLVNPHMGNVPDTILEFTTDAATNKIKGRLSAGGSALGAPVGTTFSGDIKEQAGWAELTMPIDRPNSSRPIPVYAYTILVTPTDNGLYLNACMYNITQGPSRPFARWDAVQVKP